MSLPLAGCIITDQKGKVLLLHRNTAEWQHWEIPGGKLEAGENALAAAVRETKEELGVSVKIDKLLGKKEFTEKGTVMHYSWYRAKIMSGQPKIMEPEKFDALDYFSINEMREITLSTGAKTFFAMLTTGKIII